jgi:ClpP class serine protease
MWLIQTAVRQALEQAQTSGWSPTAEQHLDFEARMSAAAGGDTPRLLTIAGNSAEIAITGAITNAPNMFAFLFGGGNTTYPDIIAALAVAEQDPEVETITLAIDSPGGTISGLFDALAAIENTTKPTRAVVSNLAASAAYAIAAQTDEIVAGNRAARFGSVGIVVSGFVDADAVAITSTDAPKKAPDISTEEGRAVVREELDAMHEIFVESIAAGRGTTIDQVNADFGQGATLLAAEAQARGMIDTLATTSLNAVSTNQTTNQPGAIDMDLNTLKASHPGVYAEALQAGVTQERERASAHIIMGQGSGDLTTALAAVQDGSEMTPSLSATYMMAAANRSDTQAATTDDLAAASAADGAASDDNDADAGKTAGAAILSLAASNCSVELGA